MVNNDVKVLTLPSVLSFLMFFLPKRVFMPVLERMSAV